jgi:oligopeptide transport system permease protein
LIRFLARRLAWFAATVWAVTAVAFVLMRSIPGGPFSSERSLHPIVEANIRARYHLDWPLWRQYLAAVGPLELGEHGLFGDGTDPFGGMLAGEFGPSLQHRDLSVDDVLAQSLPISIVLGSFALAWALVLGFGGGLISAHYRGRKPDHVARVLSTLGLALPNFVLAGLLVLLFAIVLRWLPVAGWGTPRHLVLPSLALGAPFAAYVARLFRASLLDVLSQDYIRTAVAKGLPPARILLRHALPAALMPVVSFVGPAAAGILTGSLVIEKLFCIPGAGTHFVASALNRDYTLALGVTVVYTVMVYGFNVAVDVAYTLLDPRIDLEREA